MWCFVGRISPKNKNICLREGAHYTYILILIYIYIMFIYIGMLQMPANVPAGYIISS